MEYTYRLFFTITTLANFVVPESFTHGSAEQRKRWFMTGFKEGTVKACNTFAAGSL